MNFFILFKFIQIYNCTYKIKLYFPDNFLLPIFDALIALDDSIDFTSAFEDSVVYLIKFQTHQHQDWLYDGLKFPNMHFHAMQFFKKSFFHINPKYYFLIIMILCFLLVDILLLINIFNQRVQQVIDWIIATLNYL